MGKRELKTFLAFVLLSFVLAACANNVRLQEQAGSHLNVGQAYLGSGQYNGALKEFLEAEKLTPEDPKVHYMLGIAYRGKGLDDLAIRAFRKSLALDPDDSEVHNFLGAIYLDQGRWDDAIASFNRALGNILYDTPANSLYNLGRAYYEKGQYDAALKYYRDAITREPNSVLLPQIEKNLGMTWFAKGDTEQAVRHFRKSLELAPAFVEPHYWLGLCYRKQNRPGDAVESLQKVVKAAPESELARKAKEQLKTLLP
ncbi:MAG: tetratricopeptide repeat protein [Deltaproteobacteria bacterium]|nr:tetratricopeptide repeat protein [Deltaproteobacteria bacterium]